MLELMVAYGFVPPEVIAGSRPAAAISERPQPRRTGPTLTLGVDSRPARSGQTTVIVGLAQAWSRRGRSVLLVDLDPGDELGRLLLLGSALIVNAGHSILQAALDEATAEPSQTLLPGVDIVFSGSGGAWDPDALGALLRANPLALAATLRAVQPRYDRVLVDCPAYPGALPDAVSLAVEGWLHVHSCDALADPAVLGRLSRPTFGRILNRFDSGAPPSVATMEAAARAGAFEVAIPRIAGMRSPWDAVAGTGGRRADAAFDALAAELDARLARAYDDEPVARERG